MPLISVIIPTYNRPDMVIEAVDSVLNQNFPDMELIVVDDGSTDETLDRLDAYGSRVTLLSQANKGVSAARNYGVSKSSGRYVAFLDSDDFWLPGKLFAQMDFFLNQPDARICQTEEIWVRRGHRVNPKFKHHKPSGMIFSQSLALCLVSPSAVMLRRDLFDEMNGFDESLPACEDYDLWLRIACRYPIYLIDTPLIVKRGGHGDQLSAQPCLDKYRIQSLAGLLRNAPLSESQRVETLRVLSEKCRIYGQGCLKRGKDSEGAHYLKWAGSLEDDIIQCCFP
jgi:glycosyltransferase involved in cell wall biosynthesis